MTLGAGQPAQETPAAANGPPSTLASTEVTLPSSSLAAPPKEGFFWLVAIPSAGPEDTVVTGGDVSTAPFM